MSLTISDLSYLLKLVFRFDDQTTMSIPQSITINRSASYVSVSVHSRDKKRNGV